MADDALILRISATTDEFVKRIDDAKAKVKSLTTQMAEIDKQLKTENVDKVGKLAEKLDLAKRASEMAAKEVDMYGEKIAKLTEKYQNAEQMTDKEKQQVMKLADKMAEAQQRANTLATQVDQLQKELEDAGDAAEDAADSIEDTGDAAEEASKSSWNLGDAIKANVISSVITKGLETFANLMKNIASKVLEAAKAIGRFIGESIDLAKDMEETKSKVAAVFGEEGQKQIEDWANNAAHDFHTTKQAAMESVSAFGNILMNMGMATAEAQKYSQELVLVAAAQADFNNMDTGEVLEKIQSALAGNYKGLQSLGIVLKDADITERALLETHKENADELTDLEKKQAALSIVIEKSSFAVQKYIENSRSLTSMQNELKARLVDVKTEIGERLYPVAENFFNKIVEFTNTEEFSDLLDTIYTSVDEIANAALEFLESGQLETGINWLKEQLPLVGDKISDIATKVADVITKVWDAIAAAEKFIEIFTNRGGENLDSWLAQGRQYGGGGGWIGNRASGGSVSAGGLYSINDDAGRRRELFIPSMDGYVLNGNATQSIINNNQRTSGDLNVYVNSYGTDAASIADEIGAAVNQQLRLSGAML